MLLVSVPYALKAADAETIGGKPLSAFVLAGEKTGVGADGLTYVDTRVLASGLSGGPPSPLAASARQAGRATANYVGMFTDATTLVNSVIYQTPAGSIGVNTTTPAAGVPRRVGAPRRCAYFDVYSNALGALPVVYRAARGTPAAPTAVQANDILGGLAVRGYGATAFSAGPRPGDVQGGGELDRRGATAPTCSSRRRRSADRAWAERMRITPDGNVGIGTPTPAQKLSVAGTIESTPAGSSSPTGRSRRRRRPSAPKGPSARKAQQAPRGRWAPAPSTRCNSRSGGGTD